MPSPCIHQQLSLESCMFVSLLLSYHLQPTSKRGVSLPCSHATDHTRYVLSTRSMLIADKGWLQCARWSSAKLRGRQGRPFDFRILGQQWCGSLLSPAQAVEAVFPLAERGIRDISVCLVFGFGLKPETVS